MTDEPKIIFSKAYQRGLEDPAASLARFDRERREAIDSARFAWKVAYIELALIVGLAFALCWALFVKGNP